MQSTVLIVLTLVIVVAGVGIFIYGAANIKSGILVKAICRLPKDRAALPFHIPEDQKILLTFDDGPDPDITPRVLDVLDRYNHRAIFFVIGAKAEKHPELLREIVSRGHIIGNHTYYHSPWNNFLGSRHLESEIRRTDEAVARAIGVRPTLFRPPLGVSPHFLRSLMKRTGHTVVGWDVRSLDTRGEGTEIIRHRIEKHISEGSIILLHDRLETAPALAEATLTMRIAAREE